MGSIPGSGRSPGEGNGNPSSIIAWKIPWTEDPGGLQSMRQQRVRHDRATERTYCVCYSHAKTCINIICHNTVLFITI